MVAPLTWDMLAPKKVKFRKMQKGRMRGKAYRGGRITIGEYGLKALEPGRLTSRQIEAARIAITRHVKRGGQVWTRIFPDKPITKKPAETRMGKGKGNPELWVAVVKPGSPEWWIANVKPGRVLFELSYPNEAVARTALTRAIHKLPMKCRIVTREGDL